MQAFIQITPNNTDTIHVRPDQIISVEKKCIGENLYNVAVTTVTDKFMVMEAVEAGVAEKYVNELMEQIDDCEQEAYYGDSGVGAMPHIEDFELQQGGIMVGEGLGYQSRQDGDPV